jgi:histidyl-tRNA synthetase
VVLDAADRRLDRKLRHADRLGARVAVIAGEEEVRAGRAVVRDLQAHTQESLPLHELVAGVGRILDGA